MAGSRRASLRTVVKVVGIANAIEMHRDTGCQPDHASCMRVEGMLMVETPGEGSNADNTHHLNTRKHLNTTPAKQR